MAIIHEPGPGGKGGRSTRALSIQKLLDLQGLTAIDLGSKEGYNSFDLVDCGCTRVLGVEYRQSFIDEAEQSRRELGFDQVSFMQGDVRQIDEMGLGHFDLCLCSGLLYHMQNPFNLLKRMRNLCRYLALETHVAPEFFDLFGTKPKYRGNLQWLMKTVRLDGQPFRGRLNVFPPSQDMKTTSGSIVSHATFWLSLESHRKAFDLAGYDIEALYFDGPPAGRPPIFIDHGKARTKVFVLARVREPGTTIDAGPSRIEGSPLLVN
ncbi:hypothetical protein BH09VER1_BH09VER1_18490 [soil metagenome]